MDWIKQMSLRKSLFTLTFISIIAAFILSVAAFWGCIRLRGIIAPEGIMIDPHTAAMTELPAPSKSALQFAGVLEALQIILPVLFFVTALILTSSLFYRMKLREPIALLTDSADRIMANDLDFTIRSSSSDELGQLCRAFESMRETLLSSTRELWRQNEERRRLNAAFSHDLRNPVTVLKGSVKLARKCILKDSLSIDTLMETLTRMEDYTDRIAHYVETMSSIPQLEQLPLHTETFSWSVLSSELKHTVHLIASSADIQIQFGSDAYDGNMCLDKSILFQVFENITANALRFASSNICISCSVSKTQLILSVSDDGSGFPDDLLKCGVRPFMKTGTEPEHFGMGLYICSVLCRKHGGTLRMENTMQGALVTATFNIHKV
ncbi:ATP-binding protein [Ruminococcus gauvreauii]|uniref:HAMP domain-containing sensor histidine kinase n=1 Tax=Ruminococcus gauvreauii TaxID=438033 RepID=UPI0039840647